MKHLLVLATLVLSQAALADGFYCQNVQADLNIQIFNHTDANMGTRTGSVMVLSDPRVNEGRKTIAKFTDVNTTLKSHSSVYDANVDLRYADSRAKGENIGGTKLGQLDHILVALDFSYQSPIADGQALSGAVKYVKRNGEVWTQSLRCTRYLKN